jgi:hypothetical protein
MDKCREAFEKLPVIEEIMGDDYVMFDEQFKKYLCGVGENEEYLNGAWMVWQSRQSEFDSMTEALLNQTQLLAKQKVEVEEKDKRIETALAIVSKMAKATNSTAMWAYDLEKALRGAHE